MRVILIAFLCSLLPMAEAEIMNDVQHALMPDEYQEIIVGESSFPVFDTPSSLPLTLGVAFIFADDSASGFSLFDAQHLSSSLNEKGWRTVIFPLFLNASVADQISAETAEISDPETQINAREDSRKMIADYTDIQQQLMLIMNQLYQFSDSTAGFRLVIASGMTAAQLIDLGANARIAAPDTMVSIFPYWPHYSINQALPSLVAQTPFPLLDISYAQQNPWDEKTAQQRETLARSSLKLHYRQRRLASPHIHHPTTQNQQPPHIQLLAGQILGWTRYLGW